MIYLRKGPPSVMKPGIDDEEELIIDRHAKLIEGVLIPQIGWTLIVHDSTNRVTRWFPNWEMVCAHTVLSMGLILLTSGIIDQDPLEMEPDSLMSEISMNIKEVHGTLKMLGEDLPTTLLENGLEDDSIFVAFFGDSTVSINPGNTVIEDA